MMIRWYLKRGVWIKREGILFGESDMSKYIEGIRRFCGVTLDQLHQLVDQHFLHPWTKYGNSPKVSDILNFMERHRGYIASGYAVTPQRRDCRVVLTGIEKFMPVLSDKELMEFRELFQYADELITNEYQTYCCYN